MVLGAVPEQVDGITFSAVALRVLAGTGVRVASMNEPMGRAYAASDNRLKSSPATHLQFARLA